MRPSSLFIHKSIFTKFVSERLSATINLLAVGASLGETALATGWLAQCSGACTAEDYSLCVTEHWGDVEAARALHIHEE